MKRFLFLSFFCPIDICLVTNLTYRNPLSRGVYPCRDSSFEHGFIVDPPEVVTFPNMVCKSALILALCFQHLLRHFIVMSGDKNTAHILLL